MEPEKSLKTQAQQIMVEVDRDLRRLNTAQAAGALAEVDSRANALMKTLFGVVSDVDIEAAAARVRALKKQYPRASPARLSQMLIRDKCRKTGTVGAVTSGAGLVPGLGTAAAVTLGVAADIGATFKLQAELVLEIAAVYNYPLTGQEKQQLVLLITGLSAGTSTLTRRAGQTVAVKVGEKVAEKAAGKTILKALPVLGIVASAGTNVLSTYIIGQRADAYFRLGPDAVGSWSDSLRAITGVDERTIGNWLAESGKSAGAALVSGAEKVGQAGKTAGQAVMSGAGKAAGSTAVGAQKAGRAANTGLKAYFRWVVTFWTAVFRLAGRMAGVIWQIVAFLPRKAAGLVRKKNGPA